MKTLVLILLVNTAFAQSPFKRLQRPERNLIQNTEITAYRFTGPIAGYMYPQNQVVTGVGYGFQKLHWVDSTQRYYTDFSVSAVAYAGGNVTPSPYNIMSVGVSVGVKNQLIMFGPSYNLPGKSKGSLGFVVNISVPLN